MISGVLGRSANKWNFDVTLFVSCLPFLQLQTLTYVIIYIILASIMPTKEEIEAEMYGTGPRKRKEVQAIDDNEGWFWWR